MKMVTQWLSRKTPPVHIGVYQVNEKDGWRPYAYWDGQKFGFRVGPDFYFHDRDPIKEAYRLRKSLTLLPAFVAWRGIAK